MPYPFNRTGAAGFMLAASLCFAETSAAEFNTSLDLAVSNTSFNYRELDPQNVLLDEEDGHLNGLAIGATLTGAVVFFDINIAHQDGSVDYTAFLPTQSLDSSTEATILHYQMRGGIQHPLTETLTIMATAGAGYRQWERNIQSTADASGLDEDYSWPYWSLGIGGRFHFTPRHLFKLEWQWREIRNAELEVKYHNAAFDQVSLDLPNGYGYSLAATWQYNLTTSVALQLATTYDYWDFSRSSPAPLFRQGTITGSTATEPANETEELSLSLGLKISLN